MSGIHKMRYYSMLICLLLLFSMAMNVSYTEVIPKDDITEFTTFMRNSDWKVSIEKFKNEIEFTPQYGSEAFAINWRIWYGVPALFEDDLMRYTVFKRKSPFSRVVFYYGNGQDKYIIKANGTVTRNGVLYGVAVHGRRMPDVPAKDALSVEYVELQGRIGLGIANKLAERFPNIKLIHVFGAKIDAVAFTSLFKKLSIEFINMGSGIIKKLKEIRKWPQHYIDSGQYPELMFRYCGDLITPYFPRTLPWITSDFYLEGCESLDGNPEYINIIPDSNKLKYIDELMFPPGSKRITVKLPNILGLNIVIDGDSPQDIVLEYLNALPSVRSLIIDGGDHIDIPRHVFKNGKLLDYHYDGVFQLGIGDPDVHLRSITCRLLDILKSTCPYSADSLQYLYLEKLYRHHKVRMSDLILFKNIRFISWPDNLIVDCLLPDKLSHICVRNFVDVDGNDLQELKGGEVTHIECLFLPNIDVSKKQNIKYIKCIDGKYGEYVEKILKYQVHSEYEEICVKVCTESMELVEKINKVVSNIIYVHAVGEILGYREGITLNTGSYEIHDRYYYCNGKYMRLSDAKVDNLLRRIIDSRRLW